MTATGQEGIEGVVVGRASTLDVVELAELLFRKRKGRVLTLGQASEQIGVSIATLSRLERQRHRRDAASAGGFAPDTRTLAAVARWLDVPLGRIVVAGVPTTGESEAPAPVAVVYREGESVPDKVEAHLRADRHLDDEAALALAQLFRVAYDQFSRLHQARPAPESGEKQERRDDE